MLTDKQQELAELMSDVSESTWAARWYAGLEYLLWRSLEEGDDLLSLDETLRVQQLHEDIDGWIVHDPSQPMWRRFVPTIEWIKMYDDWCRLMELDRIQAYTRAREKAPQYIIGPELFDYDMESYYDEVLSSFRVRKNG